MLDIKFVSENHECMRTVKEVYEKYSYPRRWVSSESDLMEYVKWFQNASGIEQVNGLKILEIGCGTGELANGLALTGARVTAVDLSLNSLKHARELSEKFKVKNIEFVNGNVLELPLNESEKFDIVIALGCLHYTGNTKKAFQVCTRHVSENGFFCVGLYNKIARARMRVKRAIVKTLAGNSVDNKMKWGKKLFGIGHYSMTEEVWLADKYAVPIEHYHSAREVRKWFKTNEFEVVHAKPEIGRIPELSELNWFFQKKGAFFIVTGKKKLL